MKMSKTTDERINQIVNKHLEWIDKYYKEDFSEEQKETHPCKFSGCKEIVRGRKVYCLQHANVRMLEVRRKSWKKRYDERIQQRRDTTSQKNNKTI